MSKSDELSADTEAGVPEWSGRAIINRFYGTERKSKVAKILCITIDVGLWLIKIPLSAHRKWTRADSAEKVSMIGNVAFWIACTAVVTAMWHKARIEAAELVRAREFAERGSCAVCMDTSRIDVSQICQPVTMLDFTAHAAKNEALLLVLRKSIVEGHCVITAASAGSRACLQLVMHASSWSLGTKEILAMYNPHQMDLDAECPSAITPPLSPPPTPEFEAWKQQHAADGEKQPLVMRVKPKEGTVAATAPPPPPPVPPERERVEMLVFEEPSDIYPGIVIERTRPTIAKFSFQTYDPEAKELRTRCIILKRFEATCALHGIEILNGTHYILYRGQMPLPA